MRAIYGLCALVGAACALGAVIATATGGDTAADHVIGQPDFNTGSAPAGVGGHSFTGWIAPVVDSGGRLWVTSGNRVLEFDNPLGFPDADRVFGQPDFNSDTPNNGGVSATSLNGPSSIVVDAAGRLWISDTGNHRVLEYDHPLTSNVADRVIGQSGFTVNYVNGGPLGGFNTPAGIAIDGSGRLWVADSSDNRVLEFDDPIASPIPSQVVGQTDFVSGSENAGGTRSAIGLAHPYWVAVDGAGRLWIVDVFNARVLEYDDPLGGGAADRVYGQPNFTADPQYPPTDPAGYDTPTSVWLREGRMWVADIGQSRVLEYGDALSDSPSRVFGQPDFASHAINNGGISASSLFSAAAGFTDSNGRIWIGDAGNHRLLAYDGASLPLSVGGIAERPDLAALPASTASNGHRSGLALAAGALMVTALFGALGVGLRRRSR